MLDHGLAPLLIGFLVAILTTPAGVSGAFLLVPVQISLLDITTPRVTATNLMFNVLSTPGGILSFRLHRTLDARLVRTILTGTVPAVILGSVLRVTLFQGLSTFKAFVGIVLVVLGANLVLQTIHVREGSPVGRELPEGGAVVALAGAAGLIGGIYGISGGSIIAPALVGYWGLPVRRVAPAVLLSTLVTSLIGVLSFQMLDQLAAEGVARRGPDLILAATFGLGGFLGSAFGARFSHLVPEGALRVLLGVLGAVLGMTYVLAAAL